MVFYYSRIFISMILFLLVLPLAAQSDDKIVSLEKKLTETNKPNEKAIILNDLAYQYHLINPIKTLEYANQSIVLCKKTGLKKEMLRAYYLRGIGYDMLNNTTNGLQNAKALIGLGKRHQNNLSIGSGYYLLGDIQTKISQETQAMQNYQQAFEYYKKANSKQNMANIYTRIANNYMQFSNYKQAVVYNIKAIQWFKEAKSFEGQTVAIHNLGDIYMEMKEYQIAKKYYLQSLAISKKANKDYENSWAGDDFVSLATVYIAMDSIDKAYDYYAKALNIFKKVSYVDGIASVSNNLGLILSKRKEYVTSLQYFMDAIKINQEYGIDYELGENLKNVGKLYLVQDKFRLAKSYFDQALALALKTQNAKLEFELYKCLYQYYKATADFEQSIVFLEKHYEKKEIVFGESQRKQITGLQIQYDTKEKEMEIQSLNQQNQIHLLTIAKQEASRKLGIIVFIMLLLLVSALFWLFRSKRKSNLLLLDKNQEINKKNIFLETTQKQLNISLQEKNVLLKEIHHRVKNNLQLVNSLLSIQARNSERKMDVKEFLHKSQDRIQSMALIHETLYLSDTLTAVDFQQYLEKLSRHLCSSFALDNDIIKVHIDTKAIALDIEKVIPLGLILTELMNNAIKHAFPDGEGSISITLTPKAPNFLELQFYDNGIGLPENYGDKKTLGIHLIKDLVRQLQGNLEIKKGTKGSFFIIRFLNG